MELIPEICQCLKKRHLGNAVSNRLYVLVSPGALVGQGDCFRSLLTGTILLCSGVNSFVGTNKNHNLVQAKMEPVFHGT